MTTEYQLSRLAVLVSAGLIIATQAVAQSVPTASSVTVYGVLDACIVAYKSATGAPFQINGGGCFYGSRLGFRGNEDLGGGLRAYFQLEQGFSADSGTLAQGGRAFGRKAHVGLAGAFGEVEAGRDYAPAFYLLSAVDPMKLGLGSALATVWSGSPGNGSGRTDNSFNYQTPGFGGFALRVMLAPGEQTQSQTLAARGGDTKGASIMYRSPKLTAGATYATVRNAAGTASDSATTIGAKYDFGAFSVAGIAQSGSWEGTRSSAAPSSATSIFSRRFRSYVLGGTLKLGMDSLSATYKRYDDRTATNLDANVWSFVYIHPLSKRTQLYGGFTRLKNQRASSYGAYDGNGAYTGVALGGTSRPLDLGITHFF